MQAFRSFSRVCRRQLCYDLARRSLSTVPGPSSPNASLPWFMDPSDVTTPPARAQRPPPPHLPMSAEELLAPLPAAIPADSYIAKLHAALRTSPHLQPGTLVVREPIPTAVGPPLPEAIPKGRRKRGRTYSGEPVLEYNGGIWSWVVIAQVKEGTENRGAIESVVRVVRKTLLTATPPLPLPHNNKKKMSNGWAMIDAGDFAVHIVSRDAREKFFPDKREWLYE